jgi:prephenate dehydrogenase
MTVRMTIIGLGQIGASIGLALAEHNQKVVRTGHDRYPEVARHAKKLGAVDNVTFNLHSAVEKAEVVILAIPVDDVRSTLEMIAPDLQPNALVIDTSPIKVAIAEWAKELLPQDRYFVTFTPSINPAYLNETTSGIEAAHADLFQHGLAMITSLPGTNPDAVKFAADLATLLGLKPLFADAYEADGLVAATRLLPQIMAAALVNATIDQPGWTESRKFAEKGYVQSTEPVAHLSDTEQLGQTFLLNRENVVRVTDNLIAALSQLRQTIAEEDEGTLHALLHNAREDRRIWLDQRQTAKWDPTPQSEMPRAGDVLGRLIGFGKKRSEK